LELLFEGAGGLKHFISKLAKALEYSAEDPSDRRKSYAFIIFTRISQEPGIGKF
jgi:hypothetical protein